MSASGYAWLREQHRNGTLRSLLTHAHAPWRFSDVARVDHAGEMDMGEGERRVAVIVTTTCHRRYQLKAWRSADGTLSMAESEQLPGSM